MTEIVFAHGGTVDKYIGDAVMSIFGAPFPTDNDPENAVKCALQMRQVFAKMIAEIRTITADNGTRNEWVKFRYFSIFATKSSEKNDLQREKNRAN